MTQQVTEDLLDLQIEGGLRLLVDTVVTQMHRLPFSRQFAKSYGGRMIPFSVMNPAMSS